MTCPEGGIVDRPYQDELAERALKENIICVLGTGTGKTYIAVKVIKSLAHELEGVWPMCKRTVFLVPSVPLVDQQSEYLGKLTGIPTRGYSGANGVDDWGRETWQEQFRKYRILVMVHDIFRDLLERHFIDPGNINILIIDECHHATKEHSYRNIMRILHGHGPEKTPKVLGLTASVINVKGKSKATNGLSAQARIEQELEEKAKELETCLNAIVVTSEDSSLLTVGARPDPITEYYALDALDMDTETAVSYLDDFISFLSVSLDALKSQSSAGAELQVKLALESVDKFMRDVRNAFTQVRESCITVGAYASYEIAQMLMKDLTQMRSKATDPRKADTVTMAIAQLQLYGTILENDLNIKSVVPKEIFESKRLMSNKVRRLMEVLEESHRKSSAGPGLCAIVFVTERFNCWAIHRLLSKLSAIERWSFLSTGYCVGQMEESGSEAPEFERFDNSQKQFSRTIKRFRQHNINVMVATNVLEEGFDVPRCSVVIRFDPPQNFKSYVQSKGRARAVGSKYIMMVDSKQARKFEDDLQNFQLIDQALSKFCHNRQQPRLEERDKHFAADLLGSPIRSPLSNAIITSQNALQRLQMYCNTLPNDNMSGNLVTCDFLNYRGGIFRARLHLPMSAAVKEPVVGPEATDRTEAKKLAALEACRRLIALDEFNLQSLTPNDEKDWEDDLKQYLGDHDREPKPANGPAPGTRKREQYYAKVIPNCLMPNVPAATRRYFLYIFQVAPHSGSSEVFQGQYRFGLLTQRIIPNLPSFPLFYLTDQLVAQLCQPAREISLVDQNLQSLILFQRTLFIDLLRMDHLEPTLQQSASLLVAPLRLSTGLFHSVEIDWNFVASFVAPGAFVKEPVSVLQYKPPSESQLQNAVVAAWYRGEAERFLVMNVETACNPRSMVAKDQSAADFAKKFGVEVQNMTQPLIKVRQCSKNLDFLHPKPPETKKNRDLHLIFLIPELVKVLPANQEIYNQARLLPSLIYRVTQLAAMVQLYGRLRAETRIGMNTPIPNQWTPLAYDPRRHKKKSSDGPDIGDLRIDDVPVSSPSAAISPEVESSSGSSFESNGNDEKEEDDSDPQLFLSRAQMIEVYKKRTKRRQEASALNKKLFQGSFGPGKPICEPVIHPGLMMTSCRVLSPPPFLIDAEFLRDSSSVPFPEPVKLLESLSTLKAGDILNMERLETMGDSYLKMMTCIYLFMEYPKYHEGRLEFMKSRQVSNYNLYRLAKEKKISPYVINQRFDPHGTFAVPGFDFKGIDGLNKISAATHQSISDKGVADTMEALIGAVLTVSGCRAAQDFMDWLGLRVVLKSAKIGSGLPPSKNGGLLRDWNDPITKKQFPQLSAGFDEFQNRIGYRFRNVAYLIQAFTHSSFMDNSITDCYQRLEFLGDALLDFLVTKCLFDSDQSLGPGQLTDLRSALVNNRMFAFLAAKNGFHNMIYYMSPSIFNAIRAYIEDQRRFDEDVPAMSDQMLDLHFDDDDDDSDEDDGDKIDLGGCTTAEDPKILGDVFESVAGAIFLDSGLSVDAVWRVYYNMMKDAIERCLKKCPKNPVRLLMEKEPGSCHFENAEILKGGRVSVKVTVVGNGEFVGVGNNKRIAKCNAARDALRKLKKATDSDLF